MSSEKTLKFSQYVFLVCMFVALFAVLPIESYSLYLFVRNILFVGFVVATLSTVVTENGFTWPLAIIGAFLWNPFDIIVFSKSTWIILDLVAAGLFYYWTTQIGIWLNDIDIDKARIEKAKAEDPDYERRQEESQKIRELRQSESKKQQGEEAPFMFLGFIFVALIIAGFMFFITRGLLPWVLGLMIIVGLLLTER